MTVKDLMQVQVGTESPWGTAVAATAKLMGVSACEIQPLVNTKLFKELRASLSPASTAAVSGMAGAAHLEGFGSYEDLNYALENLLGVVTPSGAGPYVRAGEAAKTATPTPKYLTLLFGNAAGVYGLAGGLGAALTLKGQAGENDTELSYSWDLIGKQVDDGALVALNDRTVNPIMMSHFQVYIDTWAGTVGTTEVLTTTMGFELSLKVDRFLKRYLGSLAPGAWEDRAFKPSDNKLKLSLELNATSKAILDALVHSAPALTQRQIRLKATDTTRIAQFDFAGTLTQAPKIFTDVDGVPTVDLEFEGTYNSGMANFFEYSITNGVVTLP